MASNTLSPASLHQAETERPLQHPVYPPRFVAVMCKLLDVNSRAWYSEFEQELGATAYKPYKASRALRRAGRDYMRYINFAVPALLRREYFKLHYDGPIESSATYETVQLSPESLDEADLIRLDDGSTIDVHVYLERYDALVAADLEWGWLGALGVKAFHSLSDYFTHSRVAAAPGSDDTDADKPTQSLKSPRQHLTGSHNLHQRHVASTS
uniref:Proteophosphoglycan ppg4 n=1 Tax=Rhodotorula toruloides TaxID=5286 RepID=A0A0K3CJX7_RHOTO